MYVLLSGLITLATSAAAVQARMDADAADHLVAHVVVALCDVETQGVVPPPNLSTCDRSKPGKNLYWGALYGVKTHLARSSDWTRVKVDTPDGVVERVVYRASIERGEKRVTAFIVADAYRDIHAAIEKTLRYAGGYDSEKLKLSDGPTLDAGGAAHLIAFVGHNGLMDFALPSVPGEKESAPPRSALVLACASRGYFEDPLTRAGSHPLLLTTGLMAPEAYVLEDVIEAWLSGSSPDETREAAAKAYDHYQKCGLRGARRLFRTTD